MNLLTCLDHPEEGTFNALAIPENFVQTMINDLDGDWEKKALFAVYENDDGSLSMYSVRRGIEEGDCLISTDKGIQEFFLVGIDLPESGGILESEELHASVKAILADVHEQIESPALPPDLNGESGVNRILYDTRTTPIAPGVARIDMSIQRTGQAVFEWYPQEPEISLGGLENELELDLDLQLDLDIELDLDLDQTAGRDEITGEQPAGEDDVDSFFTVFHRVPGAYGYYTLTARGGTLEGALIRVRMRLEEPESLSELLGRNWEDKNLYAVFLGDAVETGKMNDLAVFSAQWDKERHILSFETDKEGDFLILCGESEELNSGEAARSEWLTRKVKTFLRKKQRMPV